MLERTWNKQQAEAWHSEARPPVLGWRAGHPAPTDTHAITTRESHRISGPFGVQLVGKQFPELPAFVFRDVANGVYQVIACILHALC